MKSIKRSTLLELTDYTREYARTGKVDPPTARSEAAKDLAKQAYRDSNAWIAFLEFVGAVVGAYALYPECTNEELCDLFKALKFEVLDE